jgi:hypothetical protein
MRPVALAFAPRNDALCASGVVAFDACAVALARRVLARDDESFARLAGAACPGAIVVLGEVDALPWVDGATYVARAPGHPGILLPTTLEPNVPSAVLEAVLARAGATLPVVCVPREGRLHLLPIGRACSLDRLHLTRFVEAGT